MKKLFIRTFSAFFAFLMLFSIFNINSFATDETKSFNWYTKRNNTHTLPHPDSQFDFISDYDGYYGDLNAAKNGDKVIYLTFDAGYENGNVEKILNTLKKHNAVGNFFVLENFIVRSPELIKRMVSENHIICNHTKTHPDMSKLTDKSRFDLQLSGLDDALMKVCGVHCAKFYRAPEGKFSLQNLKFAKELGYKTIFWSFAYADWDNSKQPSEDYAIKKILDNVHPGEIMLLHPTSRTNASILDRVLTSLEKDGYRFAPLTELK